MKIQRLFTRGPILWLSLLLVSLLLGACALGASQLHIVNDGTEPTPPLEVYVAGTKIWNGQLQAGQVQSMGVRPNKDSSFKIVIHRSPEDLVTSELGYTTPGDGQEHEIHIEGSTVRYTLKGHPLPPISDGAEESD